MTNWVDDYFRLGRWPRSEAKPVVLPLPKNMVARAAKIIAVAAYPADSQLIENGPAHKFSEAMLAWMFRGAKARGKISRLPDWVASIKTQQMKNRFGAGAYQLHYRLSSFLTVLDANVVAIEHDHLKNGIIPGFTIRYSEDFSQISINLLAHTEELLPQIWQSARANGQGKRSKIIFPSSEPGAIKSSLQASVLRHRKAFRASVGDEAVVYRNIYNRYIKPTFPVLHVMSVLHQAMRDSRSPNEMVVRNPIQRLLMRPGWAESAPQKIAEKAPWAIRQLHSLRIPICACRLVRLTPP